MYEDSACNQYFSFVYKESSPGTFQMWDRSTTSDSLLGTARVSIADSLGSADRHSWYKLVGAGDQVKKGGRHFLFLGRIRFVGVLPLHSSMGGDIFLLPPPEKRLHVADAFSLHSACCRYTRSD